MAKKSLDHQKEHYAGPTHHKHPKLKDLPKPNFEVKQTQEEKALDKKKLSQKK